MNFYEFPIPAEINGDQLKKELNCAEVYIREDKLIIGGDLTKQEAATGIDKHKPIPHQERTVEDKLASVGLTIDDLKQALNL